MVEELQKRTQVGKVQAQVERKFWTLNSSNILVRTNLPTNTLDASKQAWQSLKDSGEQLCSNLQV